MIVNTIGLYIFISYNDSFLENKYYSNSIYYQNTIRTEYNFVPITNTQIINDQNESYIIFTGVWDGVGRYVTLYNKQTEETDKVILPDIDDFNTVVYDGKVYYFRLTNDFQGDMLELIERDLETKEEVSIPISNTQVGNLFLYNDKVFFTSKNNLFQVNDNKTVEIAFTLSSSGSNITHVEVNGDLIYVASEEKVILVKQLLIENVLIEMDSKITYFEYIDGVFYVQDDSSNLFSISNDITDIYSDKITYPIQSNDVITDIQVIGGTIYITQNLKQYSLKTQLDSAIVTNDLMSKFNMATLFIEGEYYGYRDIHFDENTERIFISHSALTIIENQIKISLFTTFCLQLFLPVGLFLTIKLISIKK